MKKPKPPDEIRQLAERIAADLFTSGSGEKPDHLKMYKGDKYLGGWSEHGVAHQIEAHLRSGLIEKVVPMKGTK